MNPELTDKIEELDRANSDLRPLRRHRDRHHLSLDRELIVRSFTPAVTRIFNLMGVTAIIDRHRTISPMPSLPGRAACVCDRRAARTARQSLRRQRTLHRPGAAIPDRRRQDRRRRPDIHRCHKSRTAEEQLPWPSLNTRRACRASEIADRALAAISGTAGPSAA